MENLKQSLNWEIKLKEIQIPGKKGKNPIALLRSDDDSLLSIRTERYHPVYNSDLMILKERVRRTRAFIFKGFQEFQNGKRILAFFENHRELKLCGQDVKDYLIIGNSNDASSKFFIGTSNYMYRCENQFSAKIRTFERRHDVPFNPNLIDIEELFISYEMGRRNLYQQMERMSHVRVDRTLPRRLALQLLDIHHSDHIECIFPKNKQLDLLISCMENEMDALGPTLWGVFNGVTRYTSNHLNGNPGFGIVNGLGEKMNREAKSFLMKSIENIL